MKMIKHAVAHTPLFVEGTQLKETINAQAYPGLKMSFSEPGVLFEFKNKKWITPYVNFKVLVLEKEEAPEKLEKVLKGKAND